jgi:hypothetical protein
MGSTWDKTILGTVFGPVSARRVEQLPDIYQEIASRNKVFFLDAGLYAESGEDCVHLSLSSHQKLAEAFADKVREILG